MGYAVLRIDGTYREIGNLVPGLEGISSEKEFRLDYFIESVDRMLRKKAADTILVLRGSEFSAPPFGALDAVLQQLERLRKSGKELWYYADEYEMADCYLSSACTRRILHPMGSLSFLGIARVGLFFQEALGKSNIDVKIFRRGRYKSAADAFRGKEFDQYDREQFQRLLDQTVDWFTRKVIEKGKFSSDLVDQLLGGKMLSAEKAKEFGIIEETVGIEQLFTRLKQQKKKRVKIKKPKGTFGKGRKKIAVLVHEGAIIPGKNRKSPMMGQAIGDQFMVKEIRKLREAKKVKAVVFRIFSGGGSVTASENILQALELLAKEKPLIVSLGPVAGSGGYWISGAGKKLFCEATGITGSIGVISMFFDLRKALERWGITADTVRKGESADLYSSLRAMTDREIEETEEMSERIYRQFISRVARSRSLEESYIEGLAEGRLWGGADASEQGLVDEVGGLQEAVAEAYKEAKLKRAKISFYPRMKPSFIQKMIASKAVGDAVALSNAAEIFRESRELHAKPMLLDDRLMIGRSLP